MKLHYYPDTDSLYIEISSDSAADSREVATGVVLDFTGDGRLVGTDLDQASARFDLRRLEETGLPLGA